MYCQIYKSKEKPHPMLVYHGPRAMKQKHPGDWPSGIMPPPLLVSIASSNLTTSSISGRLSGLASQQRRMMLANAFGQHLGISGRKFCQDEFYVLESPCPVQEHKIIKVAKKVPQSSTGNLFLSSQHKELNFKHVNILLYQTQELAFSSAF